MSTWENPTPVYGLSSRKPIFTPRTVAGNCCDILAKQASHPMICWGPSLQFFLLEKNHSAGFSEESQKLRGRERCGGGRGRPKRPNVDHVNKAQKPTEAGNSSAKGGPGLTASKPHPHPQGWSLVGPATLIPWNTRPQTSHLEGQGPQAAQTVLPRDYLYPGNLMAFVCIKVALG